MDNIREISITSHELLNNNNNKKSHAIKIYIIVVEGLESKNKRGIRGKKGGSLDAFEFVTLYGGKKVISLPNGSIGKTIKIYYSV